MHKCVYMCGGVNTSVYGTPIKLNVFEVSFFKQTTKVARLIKM